MKRKIIFSVLLAAMISVCAFITIPLPFTQVPIVIQNMIAVLSGQLLGPIYGGLSVLIFLIAGSIGLPVFSGGSGGIYRFVSPTGGFLIGYLLASVFTGLFFCKGSNKRHSFFYYFLSSFVGYLVIYLAGVIHFMYFQNKTLIETLLLVVVPFIIPDFVKMLLSSFISYLTAPSISRILKGTSNNPLP